MLQPSQDILGDTPKLPALPRANPRVAEVCRELLNKRSERSPEIPRLPS